MKILISIFLATMLVGCVSQEKILLRESMDAAVRPLLEDHKEWSKAIVEGRQADLTLTQEQYQNSQLLHREYNAIVEEDRSRD